MKIIHLADRYWPHGGGVEYHLAQINKRLVADGHAVSVVTVAHEPGLPKTEVHQGVTIIRIPLLSHAWCSKLLNTKGLAVLAKTWEKLHRWYYTARLIPFLRQAHVVQVHDVYWWIAPWWWLISGRLFITFHGYENEFGPTRAQKLWHQLGAAFTDGSLAIGGFHEKWYGVKPTVTSFGAVELGPVDGSVDESGDEIGDGSVDESGDQSGDGFSDESGSDANELRSRRNNSNQRNFKKRIVFIGRLQELTGARELVAAVQLLPSQLQQKLQIDMYGQGELRQELQESITQHSLPITLHGFQAHAREELYNADVAFVSQYLAILEALVARVKIISFAGSEFKKAVLQSTPYADSLEIAQSVSELAELLQKVADQPVQKNSYDNSIQAHYTWAKAQTWVALTNMYYQLWNE
jgi:glycosyltransferase involved in cell wall biosynthesis